MAYNRGIFFRLRPTSRIIPPVIAQVIPPSPPLPAPSPPVVIPPAPPIYVPPIINKIAVNLSGIEYYNDNHPERDKIRPLSEFQHFADRNIKTVRVPYRWSFLQPDLAGPLVTGGYSDTIKATLDNAQAAGVQVLLDMHEYGYSGARNGVPITGNNHVGLGQVTIDDFANHWALVMQRFGTHPALKMVDLYNEPTLYGESYPIINPTTGLQTATAIDGDPANLTIIPQAFDAATTAIRALNQNVIIVRGGNHYSSAWDSDVNRPGGFVHNDPANRTLFAAHVYPDRDNSGTNGDYLVESTTFGSAPPGVKTSPDIYGVRLKVFYDQLVKFGCQPVDGILGIVGEIGLPHGAGWPVAIANGLDFCRDHGLLPFIWAAGEYDDSYPYYIGPKGNGLQAEQMSLITPRLGAPEPTLVQVTGPARGVNGQPTAPYTVLYRGNLAAPLAVQISDTGGWTKPADVMLPAGRNPSVQFTLTPTDTNINHITVSVIGMTTVSEFNTPNVDAQTDSTGALITSAAPDAYYQITSVIPTPFSENRLVVTTWAGPIVRVANQSGQTLDVFPTVRVGNYYTVDQNIIANFFGGSTATGYIDRMYDQSGAGRHYQYGSGNRGVYVLAGTQNGFPLVHHTSNQQGGAVVKWGPISGQTMMKRTKYVSGSRLMVSTSNIYGTTGVQAPLYGIHTGALGSSAGQQNISAGLLTDAVHNYVWRTKSNSANGQQSFRDDVLIDQKDTLGPYAGPLTWDSDYLEQNFRFAADNVQEYLEEMVYVPLDLTDVEVQRITASWNDFATVQAPVITAPPVVTAPIDTPFDRPTTHTFVAPANMKGVNISGGEIGDRNTQFPGYSYGNGYEYDYYKSKGMNLIRQPHKDFRVQPTSFQTLSTTETQRLRDFMNYAYNIDMYVILDPHDYGAVTDSYDLGRAGGTSIGTDRGLAIFVDYWTRLGSKFKNYPNAVFGLMNEPAQSDLTATKWRDAAIAAYNAIRSTGATNTILIPSGSSYTGAWAWANSQGSLWDAWLSTNPTNFMFEMHQYQNGNTSGATSTDGKQHYAYDGTGTDVIANSGATILQSATDWCRARGVKAFLGEFGWSANDTQASGGVPSKEGNDLVQFMKTNSDVWGGWSYWIGGKADISPGPFGIKPQYSNGKPVPGTDQPQTAILQAAL